MKPVISNTKRTWLRSALASRMKSTFVVPAVGAALLMGGGVSAFAANYTVVGSGGDNVTSFNTLADAITANNSGGGGNTISFAPSALVNNTYTFTGDDINLPPITNGVTINGDGVIINANNNRGFIVGINSTHIDVNFNSLTIENALAKGGNGGNGYNAGGAGAGLGGAIFVNSNANVTLNSVSFSNNQAEGGNGGTNVAAEGGGGGAMNGGNGGNGGGHGGGGGGGGLDGNGATSSTITGGAGGTSNGQADGGAGGDQGQGGNSGVTFGGGGGGGHSTIATAGGNGGYGGGGGGPYGSSITGGSGGFGGGGSANGGSGGFGGGNGTASGGTGGGGAGFGGAVFVRSGGSLTIEGSTDINGNNVNFGTGGNNGQAAGSGLFLNGQNVTIGSNADTVDSLITINDDIADSSGDTLNDNEHGAGSITKDGAGTLILGGDNTYSGATSVNGGILQNNGTIANSYVTAYAGGKFVNYGTVGDPTADAGEVDNGNADGTSPGTVAEGYSIHGGTFNNYVNSTITGDAAVGGDAGGSVDTDDSSTFNNYGDIDGNVTVYHGHFNDIGGTIGGTTTISGGFFNEEFIPNQGVNNGATNSASLGHQTLTGGEGDYGNNDVALDAFSDNNSDTINIDGIEADDATVNIGGGRHEVHGDGNDYRVIINTQDGDDNAISLTNGATATLSGGTNYFYGSSGLGGDKFVNTVNGNVNVDGSTFNLDAGSISADSFQDTGNKTGNYVDGNVTSTNSTLNITGQTTSVDNTGNNLSYNKITGSIGATNSTINVTGHNNSADDGISLTGSVLNINSNTVNNISNQNLKNSIGGDVTMDSDSIVRVGGLSGAFTTSNNNTVLNQMDGNVALNGGALNLESTLFYNQASDNVVTNAVHGTLDLTGGGSVTQLGFMLNSGGTDNSGNIINNKINQDLNLGGSAMFKQGGGSIGLDGSNNQVNNIITGDVTVSGGTLQQQGGYIEGYDNTGDNGSSAYHSATDDKGNVVTNIIHGSVTVDSGNFLIDGERNIVTGGVTTTSTTGTHIGGGDVYAGGATIHNESTADHTVSGGGNLHLGTNPAPAQQTISSTGVGNTILNRVIGDSDLDIEGSITVNGGTLGLGDGLPDSGTLFIDNVNNHITNEVSSSYTADGAAQLQTVTNGGEVLLGGRDITSDNTGNTVDNIIDQDVTLSNSILALAGTGTGSTTGANAAVVNNTVTGNVTANGSSFVQFQGADNADAFNTIDGSVTLNDNSLLIAQDGGGDLSQSGNKVNGGIEVNGAGYSTFLGVPLSVVVGTSTGGSGIAQNNSLDGDIQFTGTGPNGGVGIGADINNSGVSGSNNITNTHLGYIDTDAGAESGDVILEGIVTDGGGAGPTNIANSQVGYVALNDGDVTMTGSFATTEVHITNNIYGSVQLNNTGTLTLAGNQNAADSTHTITNYISQGAYLNGASDGIATGAHNTISGGVVLNTDTYAYDHGGEDEHNDITTLTIGGGTNAGGDVTNSLVTPQVTINANPYSSEQRAADHGYDTDSGHLLVGAYGASNTTNGHNITNELTGNVLLNSGFANDVNNTGTGDGSYTGGMVIVGGADNNTTGGGTVTNEIDGTVTLHGGSRLHMGGDQFDNATGGAVNNTITGAVTVDGNSFIAMWGEQDANNRLHNTIGSGVSSSSYGLTLSGNALFHAEGMDDTVGGLGTELNGSSTAQFAGGAFNNRLINNMHGGYTLNNSSTLQIGDRSIFTDGSALVQTNTIDSNGTNGNVVLNDSSLLKVLSGGAGGTHSAVGSNAIADNLTLNGNEGSTSFLTTIGTQGDPTPATPNSVATGVAVGGTAALNGAQVKVLSTDDQFTFGRRYTLVQAIGAGSVTSGFAAQGELTDENGNVLTQPAALDLATGWNSSSAWLDFLTDFHDVANTTNQRHFGQYLDDLVANSGPDGIAPGSNLSTELNYLVSQDNPNAYNDFMGDSYSAFDTVGYWNTNNFVNSIATHARQSHDNDWTESFALNAQNGLSGVGAQMSLVQQLLNSRPAMALNANGNNGNSDSALWGEIGGHWLRNDGDSSLGSPDWSQNSKSVNIGYQGGGDSFSWGITGGYHDGDIDFNNRAASGDNDGWNLGLNGLWKSKSNVYVNGVLSYGHESDSLTRNDGLGTNKSDFNAKSYAGMLEIGKRIDKKTYNFTPYASILGVHYDRDALSESGIGSGVNSSLNVNGESHSYFTSALGIRIGRDYLDASGAKRGGVMLGANWQHQFSSTDFPVEASLQGAGGMTPTSFTTYGTPLSSDSFGIQLGAYGRLSRNIYGFLNYSGNFGGSQKINSITAGLQYGF